MPKTAVYTSATYTYFSRARTLAESVKRFHPEWHMCLVCPDDPPAGVTIDWSTEKFDSVITLEDLQIPAIKSWLFRHNVIELCTAVKGLAMQALQARGFEHVLYIDPDIVVFSSLDNVTELLSSHSILLTPHQVTPETTDRAVIDNEWGSLKHGVYNLGFVGVHTDTVGAAFASWWAQRLHDYCRDDVPNGLFTDQRWCDLVPAMFDRVYIVRDPGYNVASWNISNRRVRILDSGDIVVNDSPLKFFHFTKVDHVGETMLRRYADRELDVLELMYWYRGQLKKNALEGVPDRYWAYNRYEDGSFIEPNARRSYATLQDAARKFPDPFSVVPPSFRDWYAAAGTG
jgi:hypothetical protein